MSSPASPGRRLRAHLRHQAVGYAALFVALGGTAGAAGVAITSSNQIAPGILLSSHLKDGTVTGADVAPETLGSAQIANSSVKAEDLSAGAVGAPEVRPSSLGGAQIADGTLTGADLEDGSVGRADLARLPGANVTHSGDQLVPTGTATPLKFDGEFYDDAAMHAAADPTKLVAPVTGRYLVQGSAVWGHFTDGTFRSIAIRQNGTTDVARQGGFQSQRSGVGDLAQQVSVTMNLQAGEFVQLVGFQTAGDDERVVKDGQASPAFSLQYLGR